MVTTARLRPSAWAGMPPSPWLLLCLATQTSACRVYGHGVQGR